MQPRDRVFAAMQPRDRVFAAMQPRDRTFASTTAKVPHWYSLN